MNAVTAPEQASLQTDPIHELVDFVQRADFADLPEEAVQATLKAIVDTVGAGIAGSSSALGQMLLELAHESGASGPSSSFVHGLRLPAHEAGFLNGVMARCRELDDVHEGTQRLGGGVAGHVNSMIVPAAFAVAESMDRPVSGQELILAIAVGADVVIRMRTAAGAAGKLGFMAETVGPFGVAATAAKLLGLGPKETASAMGAAYSFCSGSTLSNGDGGWDIWLPSGHATRAGIYAVQLARKGYVGSRIPLLGVAGLYPLYFRGEFHRETLLSELGRVFEIANMSIKPYSCCKCSHNAIHTSLALQKTHGFAAADIERIEVRTCSWNVKLVVLNDQGEHKHAPRSLNEAQFSMPFVIATALAKGHVFLDVLTEQALQDPEILALSHKVRVQATAEKDAYMAAEGFPPDDVDVHLKDGRVLSASSAHAKGHPLNPMSYDEVVEKFQRAARFAAKPLEQSQLDAFTATVARLAQQADVRGLMRLLTAAD